ncbi:hypothetical protein glysoja_008453 [Glycine soja]|nr:hypothetical protein glysoja_008453 [Glycine soja]
MGPCTWGMFHSQTTSSFAMFFSMPNHKPPPYMIPTTFMTILPSLPLPLLPLTATSPSVPLPPASPKTKKRKLPPPPSQKTKKNEAATNVVSSLTSAGTYYNPNTTTLNPIPSPPKPPTPPILSSFAVAPIVIPLLLLSREMAPVALRYVNNYNI